MRKATLIFTSLFLLWNAHLPLFGKGADGKKANPETDFQVVLTKDGEGARIVKYVGRSADVVIPSTIQGVPVLEVADFFCGGGFNRKNKTIKNIVFPDTVREVGALSGYVALESVTLPSSLEKIGCTATSNGNSYGMFEGCKALKSINLPPAVRRIEQNAFKGCSSLSEMTIPTGVSFYDFAETAFVGTKLPLNTQARLRQLGYKGRF